MKIKNNQKGFTLIELLAVIIILSIILLIAVPSVTQSINNTRKKTFVDNAKSILKSAIVEVNSGKYPLYDIDTTYYISTSCLKKEKGDQTSSFGGKWEKEYVAVTYDGNGFDYYYTAIDSHKKGMYLVYSNLLSESFIKSGIEELPINIGIGDRERIVTYDELACEEEEEPENAPAVYQIYDKSYYDPEVGVPSFKMENECTFGGKNGTITNCGIYDGKKYIDTGVKPFTKENANKDFEVSFDLLEFNTNDQPGETQATLFACKLESGNYTGMVVRRINSNLEFRHKFGNNNKGHTFSPNHHSIKITRKSNIVYFSYNDKPLEKIQDMEGFTEYFDHSIWIGAAQDSNGEPFRYGKFKIANLKVRISETEEELMEKNLHTVFSLDSCTFNGKDGVITNCGSYNGQKYIDTGISLYGTQTYKKDFMISFNIDSISSTQDTGLQQTLLVNKLETGKNPGLVLRIKDSNMELGHKINSVGITKMTSRNKLKSIRIYRKSGIVYYSFNNELLTKLQDGQNFNEYFDDTLWLGAAKDADGNPYRHIRASISNVVIKTS